MKQIFYLFFLVILAGWEQQSSWGAWEEPLDPQKIFCPEDPVSTLLEVSLQPKKKQFRFGEEPRFTIHFRNISKQSISLKGEVIKGAQFSPYFHLGLFKEGEEKDQGESADLEIRTGNGVLLPRAAFEIDFPSKPHFLTTKDEYRLNPQALLPGKYVAFINFWILNEGLNTRALSKAVTFEIQGDASQDLEIIQLIQQGTSLPKGFSFVLERMPHHRVHLYGENRSSEDVYLGNDWRWWRKYPGKTPTLDHEGERPTKRIHIPPGEKKLLATTKVSGGTMRGTYQIEFRYYNGEGKFITKSNRVKSHL